MDAGAQRGLDAASSWSGGARRGTDTRLLGAERLRLHGSCVAKQQRPAERAERGRGAAAAASWLRVRRGTDAQFLGSCDRFLGSSP